MRIVLCAWVVLASVVVPIWVVNAHAGGQNATPAAPPPLKRPALDANDRLTIALDADAATVANQACQQHGAYQLALKIRRASDASFRAKYPGWQMNWTTKQLEAIRK